MITKDTRNKLIEKLILHEGMKLKVYDDANGKEIRAGDTLVGHPTIGVGRNVAGDGLGITEEEACKSYGKNNIDVFVSKFRPMSNMISMSKEKCFLK